MNNRKTVWSSKYIENEESKIAVSNIAKKNNISEICASLIYNRGYKNPEDASKFLNFDDVVIHSPLLLKDVEKAVERIQLALANNERIVIYGDYDVDGVTSVTMLYLYLKNLGAQVSYYIPNRIGEGYGLSVDAIQMLSSYDVSLIITVDTGVTAVNEVEFASTLGIDVIVTDHHECQQILPNAVAVVNPHRYDCQYPFKFLAGVGVIFKVKSDTSSQEDCEEDTDGFGIFTFNHGDDKREERCHQQDTDNGIVEFFEIEFPHGRAFGRG